MPAGVGEKLYLGGCCFGGGFGGGWGGGGGGVFWGGVGGGCVHQNRAYRSKVPGGCAKTTDLSNY